MNIKIAVIGLGYVGLPLAVEFGRKYSVVGFDVNPKRVAELQNGYDGTRESDTQDILALTAQSTQPDTHHGLTFTSDTSDIADANVYIIAVPTPIDNFYQPDLTPLLSASEIVGKALKVNDVVIYESTVYPGCTEEDCVPVLEKHSGLKYNTQFYCGYSPERVNPGDKVNILTKIKKITSGSTPATALFVDRLYNTIITAGTHRAPSIKVAEAAKAVENAQRDINISFMNELALICDRCGIDTGDVIDAAATKWNFLPFRPGLVGGHCISVDPYYLAHKANALGYNPEVILSGRRVNNSIAKFIADKTMKLMIRADKKIKGARVLILGITFKENCPDCRNTKVVDIVRELQDFGCHVDVYDPWPEPAKVQAEYGITLLPTLPPPPSTRQTTTYDAPTHTSTSHYDALILCVPHTTFRTIDYTPYHTAGTIIFDVKGILPRPLTSARL